MYSLNEKAGLAYFDLFKAFFQEIGNRRNKTIKDNAPSYLGGSISNYTKNLVMTFPVLCDNSLPPETASMISRANERNIVAMLEMLFASMQLKGTDGMEVLSRIHKNINSNMSLDDYIDLSNEIAENIPDGFGFKFESKGLSQADERTIIKEMIEYLKTPSKSFPVESFSEKSLNSYSVYNVIGESVVREDLDSMKYDLDEKKYKLSVDKNERDITSNSVEFLTKQLMDVDVKKANEMQPTLMIVKYNEVDADNKIYAQRPFVAGVKSRLISVDSSDIIDRMIAKNKTKVSFLNLIRATTGEISFIRDFLFGINQAKIDAKNSVKKGPAAKMWKVLENRSIKNNYNKILHSGNDASSITTLVFNQETVNILKKDFDFDIENISNARMIMDAYNLLGIIIADESISVCKFLYAGNDSFEQQAYSFIERESNDKSYRQVINLIGKMNRGY